MLRETSGEQKTGVVVDAEADAHDSCCVTWQCDGPHIVHAYHIHWSELYYRPELWGNNLALCPLAAFAGGDPSSDMSASGIPRSIALLLSSTRSVHGRRAGNAISDPPLPPKCKLPAYYSLLARTAWPPRLLSSRTYFPISSLIFVLSSSIPAPILLSQTRDSRRPPRKTSISTSATI